MMQKKQIQILFTLGTNLVVVSCAKNTDRSVSSIVSLVKISCNISEK